jgi:hypothetical protein
MVRERGFDGKNRFCVFSFNFIYIRFYLCYFMLLLRWGGGSVRSAIIKKCTY